MIVTEEEAKTKRCQEGFAAATGISANGVPVMQPESPGPISYHGDAGYYGVSRGGAPMNCIGSACMSWNWLYGNKDSAGIDRTKGDDYARGFCGKARG